VVVALVGVALVAQAARKGVQKVRVGRAVRAMAFGAPFSRPTCNGVVLKRKRTDFFSVAGDAHLLDGGDLFAGRFAGMDIVTIAADHSPFGKGMVKVEAKFADFPLMAAPANRYLTSL
jgi:hypothetical protein